MAASDSLFDETLVPRLAIVAGFVGDNVSLPVEATLAFVSGVNAGLLSVELVPTFDAVMASLGAAVLLMENVA